MLLKQIKQEGLHYKPFGKARLAAKGLTSTKPPKIVNFVVQLSNLG